MQTYIPKYFYPPSLIKVASKKFQFNHKQPSFNANSICSLDTHASYQLAMQEEASYVSEIACLYYALASIIASIGESRP